MQILITGASGFVGKALNKMLTDAGHITQLINRNFVLDDFKTVNYDCLIHLAGRAHVMKDDKRLALQLYRAVNVDYTLKVAQLAKSLNVKRFIFLSSVKVNGESSDHPFNESDRPSPCDAYGVSKLEAEIMLKEFCERNCIEWVVIRSPLIYGFDVQANFSSLLKLSALPIPMPFACVDNKRSFVSLDNLNHFIELCCQHPDAANDTFFVSDGDDISIGETIRSIRLALGRRPLLFNMPTKWLKAMLFLFGKQSLSNRLLGNLQVDITKAKRLLGWQPIISFNAGIKQLIERRHD